jgi:pyruvate dehydrogenase E1 component alpha subunit
VLLWESLDPIPRHRRYLEIRGLWSDACETRVGTRAAAARQSLRDAVFDAPDVDATAVFEHVFASPTPELRRQAAQMADELAREG